MLLLIDELVDDGIVLETNSNQLLETVSQFMKSQEQVMELNLSDQSLIQAFQAGKDSFARFILK